MFLIPFNTGVWGFKMIDRLFVLHNLNETDMPEALRENDILTALDGYWQRRKNQCDEIPDRDTFVAVMAFIAAEPNPLEVIQAATNDRRKIYKQFFPIAPEQRQHLRNCPPFIRYAVRTSRGQRGRAIVRDTVFNPRTITGAVQ